MTHDQKKKLHECALTIPSMAWLLALFLVPTVLIALVAFKPYDYAATLGIGKGWTFSSIASILDKDYPLIVWRTTWVSVLSTAICIALGVPMAYFMARISAKARQIVLILTIVPFWTSFIIRIFSWMQVLHTDGVVKRTLVWFGLIQPDATLMYHIGSVMLVIVYTSLPFAILPLYAAAEKFDFGLVNAAMDLGATRMRALVSTFIPGIRTGIMFAALMVLIPNLGCYVASEVIGGTDCILVGNRIKDCAFELRNLPYASALSLFLILGIAATLLVILALIRIVGGKSAIADVTAHIKEAGR